ncbi:MAG: BolA family protein [Rhodospirillaceae bacterium]
MTITERIRRKLTDALAPTRLEIIDDSDSHVGHAGRHPEGESHFRVVVVSAAFNGQPTVARHRTVYGVLAEEMAERVHALGLRTLTPNEDDMNRP